MQSQKANLVTAAATLAKTAPFQWQQFLEALAVYTETHKDNLVKSPLERLQIAQGQAQAMVSFTDDMINCIKNADAINTGKKV